MEELTGMFKYFEENDMRPLCLHTKKINDAGRVEMVNFSPSWGSIVKSRNGKHYIIDNKGTQYVCDENGYRS